MLEQTIRGMRGEQVAEVTEPQLNLGLNIRIPADYIAQENHRLRIYKRIAGVESESQLADVSAELRDRYGEPSASVRNLLDYASLKLLAQRVRVMQIERKRDLVSIRFDGKAEVDAEKLAQFVARHRGTQFTPQGVLKFTIKSNQADELLESLRQVLENIASASVTAAG